ncbi:MAG: hypothetical protein ACAF41_25130 [Leptolyngbya sp. BL-A-14]
MNDQSADSSNSLIPRYPVRLFEVIVITVGAIAVVGIGVVGLGIKILDNAFNPRRAEAIAKSLIDYTIPGKSQGVFGINIGSAKFAWIRSVTTPPDVILFIGESPVNQEKDDAESSELDEEFQRFPSDSVAQEFVATTSRIETKTFCGKPVPVTIQEGQQTFSYAEPQPAVQYTARSMEGSVERVAILTTSGRDAQARAIAIFNSFRCQ